MICEKMKNQFSEYLDETLSVEQKAAFEQHLSECSNCRKEFDELLDSWEILDEYQVPQISPDFTDAVIQKAEQRQKISEKTKSLFDRFLDTFAIKFAFVPAFASLLIILGIGYYLITGAPTGIVDKPQISNTQKAEIVRNVQDEEIIRNLEIYENLDMLENLDLLVDLEAVENLEADN